MVFNALAIEFIIQFDEESVGPLLALQEGLFGIDTADFTEGVVAAVDRIERESAGYTSMNVFVAKLCKMGPAKAALVYCLRMWVGHPPGAARAARVLRDRAAGELDHSKRRSSWAGG